MCLTLSRLITSDVLKQRDSDRIFTTRKGISNELDVGLDIAGKVHAEGAMLEASSEATSHLCFCMINENSEDDALRVIERQKENVECVCA